MRGASCASNDENESNFLEREEVFCCEETIERKERKEKRRGNREKMEEREDLLFFLVLFVFEQRAK